MSDCRKYVDYIMEQAKNLLAIDSPSGYGREVTEYLLKELEALGAVSYTHLDVYKRQPLHWPAWQPNQVNKQEGLLCLIQRSQSPVNSF